ncbi:MAG: SDR family oxidoreductase [Candidatus Omnitrophota bacterium]|jgi:nucleoside-diphosphate-sugar epimerase
MSQFLVTGGAGFIGSHIVQRLVRDNHKVKVLDNFSSVKMSNLEGIINKIELIKGDICSFDNCDKAASGVDFVLHQAALRSVPKSMADPAIYNEVNISGTLNMLEACRKNGVKRFVFASSSSVYGEVKKFPEKESFSPHPISPYALTKLTGEYYCNIFALYYGVETVSLRYFNVFGPRQALDDEYAVVIPKFIHCMLHDKPVPVYGNGRQSRDFTFVDNVVNANILAASAKALGGKVFNIASGKNYTILDLIRFLNKILKKNIAPEFFDERKGDVFKTLADISNAKRYLGFSPQVNFVKGLEKTVEYFKQNA